MSVSINYLHTVFPSYRKGYKVNLKLSTMDIPSGLWVETLIFGKNTISDYSHDLSNKEACLEKEHCLLSDQTEQMNDLLFQNTKINEICLKEFGFVLLCIELDGILDK